MSAPAKEAPKAPAADPLADLAERIYVQLAARVYGNLAGGDVKKPDPKALAAYSYKLAEAFDAASKETDRAKAAIEAANKAKVKLDEVDLSSVFGATKK
jgi:predicted nucleotidyltransferase